MFAILTDKKGFHKVVPINAAYPLSTIRFAALEQQPIAPRGDIAMESVEVNERTFHYERQVSRDTFLYRER